MADAPITYASLNNVTVTSTLAAESRKNRAHAGMIIFLFAHPVLRGLLWLTPLSLMQV